MKFLVVFISTVSLFFNCGCSLVQSAWSPDSTRIVFPVYKQASYPSNFSLSGIACYDTRSGKANMITFPKKHTNPVTMLPWFVNNDLFLSIEPKTHSLNNPLYPIKAQLIEPSIGAVFDIYHLPVAGMQSGVIHNNQFIYEFCCLFEDSKKGFNELDPTTWPPFGIRIYNLTDKTEQILFEKQIIFHVLSMKDDIGFIGFPPYELQSQEPLSPEKEWALVDEMYSVILFGKILPEERSQTVLAKITAHDLGGKSFFPMIYGTSSTKNRIAAFVNVLPVAASALDVESSDDSNFDTDELMQNETAHKFRKLIIVQDDGAILHNNNIPSAWNLPTPIQLANEGDIIYAIDLDPIEHELLVIEYDYRTKDTRRIPILKPIIIPNVDLRKHSTEKLFKYDLKISPDGKTLALTTTPWDKVSTVDEITAKNKSNNKSKRSTVPFNNAPLYLIDLTSPERTVTAINVEK